MFLVLGAPMYNFSIPTPLKAWIGLELPRPAARSATPRKAAGPGWRQEGTNHLLSRPARWLALRMRRRSTIKRPI